MCCWWSVFKNLFTESLLFWPLQHCALWKIKNFQSTHTAEFYFLDFQILIPTAWWFSFFLEVSPFFFHLCMGLLTLFFLKKKDIFSIPLHAYFKKVNLWSLYHMWSVQNKVWCFIQQSTQLPSFTLCSSHLDLCSPMPDDFSFVL